MKIISFFYYKKNENLIPVALPLFRYKEKINKNIKKLIYFFQMNQQKKKLNIEYK